MTEAAEEVAQLLKDPPTPPPATTIEKARSLPRRLPGEQPRAATIAQRPPLTASTDVMFAAHTAILATAVSSYAASIASLFADFAERIDQVQRRPPLWLYDPAATNYHYSSAKSSE